jgi:hypothetical protein
MFVNTNSSVIDAIYESPRRSLYDPASMKYPSIIAPSGFALESYTQTVVENLRHFTDDCNSLQGFMVFNSIAGNTGSYLACNQWLSALNSLMPSSTLIKVSEEVCGSDNELGK